MKGSDEESVPAATRPIFGSLRQSARNQLLCIGYLEITREQSTLAGQTEEKSNHP